MSTGELEKLVAIETGAMIVLAPETEGVSIVIGAVAILGTFIVYAFKHK